MSIAYDISMNISQRLSRLEQRVSQLERKNKRLRAENIRLRRESIKPKIRGRVLKRKPLGHIKRIKHKKTSIFKKTPKIKKSEILTGRRQMLKSGRFCEYVEYDAPMKRRKYKLKIHFRFVKGSKHTDKTGVSGYFYMSHYKEAYNQCLKIAMQQVNFSPDRVYPLKISYVSYKYYKLKR